ncbi:MAG TPA: AAA family ATPase, partial [Prochlorococcaceae cyanobacterium AMR_MDS_5431]|nr:AAA family ATPase [Prochlorococcaceae cyanobacterium AMR_MDS_5431]
MMSIVSSIITTTQLSRSCILTNTKLSEDRHLNNVPKIWYGERDGEHITSLLGNLRPKHLNEYIGQQELKQVLKIAIQATCARKEALDHLLLYGPPGLGKTTIALIIAQELGVHCHIVSAPALERPRDIIG